VDHSGWRLAGLPSAGPGDTRRGPPRFFWGKVPARVIRGQGPNFKVCSASPAGQKLNGNKQISFRQFMYYTSTFERHNSDSYSNITCSRGESADPRRHLGSATRIPVSVQHTVLEGQAPAGRASKHTAAQRKQEQRPARNDCREDWWNPPVVRQDEMWYCHSFEQQLREIV
jgi:hypothetical protein